MEYVGLGFGGFGIRVGGREGLIDRCVQACEGGL